MYPKILDFEAVAIRSFDMSLPRTSLCPLVVSRASDQTILSSRFETRDDLSVIRGYGSILAEMSAIVPDGLVCFFVSYEVMEKMVASWIDQVMVGFFEIFL